MLPLQGAPYGLAWTLTNDLEIRSPLAIPLNDLVGQIPFDPPIRPTAVVAKENAVRHQFLWEYRLAAKKAVVFDESVPAE